MTFQGFGKDTVAFLAGLSAHNDKAWFDAHRADYDAHFVAPALAFAEAVGAKLQALDPDVVIEPRVNGNLFRINRDVRFSKDKTPYKDHLDMWFWAGERNRGSGFFLRVTPTHVLLGAGLHMLQKADLDAYREAVADDARGVALTKALERCERAGYRVDGSHYKKVPAGYAADHPRAALLRHAYLAVVHEQPHPSELGSKAFVTWCAKHWKAMLPVHTFMREVLG